jgi:hypothetical protein
MHLTQTEMYSDNNKKKGIVSYKVGISQAYSEETLSLNNSLGHGLFRPRF